MKQIVLTLLFVMAAVSGLSAQEDKDMLIVYEVNGMVKTINKSKAILVKRLDSLSFASKLNIPEEGFIKLIDKKGRKMYTLKNKCSGRISALIENQKQAGKNLSNQYFAYVLRNLTRNDNSRIFNTGLTTGIYRNDADSLLCDIDSLQNVVDSLQNVINSMVPDSLKKK